MYTYYEPIFEKGCMLSSFEKNNSLLYMIEWVHPWIETKPFFFLSHFENFKNSDIIIYWFWGLGFFELGKEINK